MSGFDRAWNRWLKFEVGGVPNGGYNDHPADEGGPTKWGISQRFARAKGYRGSMRDLPELHAYNWLKGSVWDRYKLDEVAEGSDEIAAYLFGMAGQHGRWTRLVQEAVSKFLTITVDGVWGPETHHATVTAAAVSPGPFLDALRVRRCQYGVELVSARRSREVFLFGWMRRWLS